MPHQLTDWTASVTSKQWHTAQHRWDQNNQMWRLPLSLPVKAACLAPEGQGRAQLATGCMLLAQLQLVLAMYSLRSTLAFSTGN